MRREVVERFGAGVLDGSGAIDRAALARIVFADRGELDALEALLHPRVVREYLAWREELGGERRFDEVVVITAPPDVRAARTAVADAREERLLPDDEKVRRADFAYVNDGTLDDLDRFVGEVLEQLS